MRLCKQVQRQPGQMKEVITYMARLESKVFLSSSRKNCTQYAGKAILNVKCNIINFYSLQYDIDSK